MRRDTAIARTFLCGAAKSLSAVRGGDAIRLVANGPDANVLMKIEDVSAAMASNVPKRCLDLIDIATYVYVADQAVARADGGHVDGTSSDPQIGHGWRRRLKFRIAVREPRFWSQPEIVHSLASTLGFLSDDEYAFEFLATQTSVPTDGYFRYAAGSGERALEEVVLFSGGLDSLGGAIAEAVVAQRSVALVNHRSTEKGTPRRKALLKGLLARSKVRPMIVPVRIHKSGEWGREYTQRSRSFLYASLAATIAIMNGLRRIRFYENGVVWDADETTDTRNA